MDARENVSITVLKYFLLFKKLAVFTPFESNPNITKTALINHTLEQTQINIMNYKQN